MSHFVYIVECKDGSLYTGYTTDIAKRLAEHNGVGNTATNRSAGARYTRGRRPIALRHQEIFETKSAAMQREYAIKKLSRPQKLVLIKSTKK